MKLLTALLLTLFMALPAIAQTNAAAQQVQIAAQVNFGLGYYTNQSLFSYTEPGTTTAKWPSQTIVVVPAATQDQAITLSTLFPYNNSALLWGLQDISSPGQAFSWGMQAAGGRFDCPAGGFMMTRVSGSNPTLYVDNDSVDTAVILKVFCLSN